MLLSCQYSIPQHAWTFCTFLPFCSQTNDILTCIQKDSWKATPPLPKCFVFCQVMRHANYTVGYIFINTNVLLLVLLLFSAGRQIITYNFLSFVVMYLGMILLIYKKHHLIRATNERKKRRGKRIFFPVSLHIESILMQDQNEETGPREELCTRFSRDSFCWLFF